VSREHPLALHRLVPVGIVVLLGLVALLALRGPEWYQRLYHPLRYADVIGADARAAHVDPYLVAAIINVESGFAVEDVSPAGAVGLMQLMPATAKEVVRDAGADVATDVAALKDPVTNVLIGTLHLAALQEAYASDEEALAAYNAGSGNADKWRRRAASEKRTFRDVIQFPETRAYVDDVLEQRDVYARLYPGAFEEAPK
jgi:soluble lytic murein transglycosylase